MALGNLTVGGAGKSSLARWLALEAAEAGARAAIILRGHGAEAPPRQGGVVPDFEGYPLLQSMGRYGDEAIAHRLALPRKAVVATDPDRLRAARALRGGYGARVLVLDDGWEQDGLRWDELWVVLDPRLPVGNGALLPAGPLRRPASTLREATRIVFLLEDPCDPIAEATLAWAARFAPGIPSLRFARTLRCLTPVGEPAAGERLRRGAPVALVSGIGAPSRLERFVRAAGADVRFHAVYPDHARWTRASLTASAGRARREGAEEIWITEKDEPRWPPQLRTDLPVRVIRTTIGPLDPVEDALGPLRAAVARAERIV
jgi:tetraacyldisaccharide 4'-kinase